MGGTGKRAKWWCTSNILLEKANHEVWMLTLYGKSERASIAGHVLKKISEAIDRE